MLLQIGPLLRLGSKCYYGWDLYYTWVQLLHLCPLLLWKTSKSRLSQLLGWRITVTTKYSENVARSCDELALCSKELCSMWSFRQFEMVVSSTDQQQARRHSAEIIKLLVPQGKNEAFRSRLGYRNLRRYECRGLIQMSRTATGGKHYFCYLFCCVFR